MKASKQTIVGLLGLILLLLGCCVVTTIRASSLEKRLHRLEASYAARSGQRALPNARDPIAPNQPRISELAEPFGPAP